MCRSLIQVNQVKLNIDKVISSGKFKVFLATSASTQEQFAVKTFQKDEYSHRLFRKEKRIHSSLAHNNIIQYVPDHLFEFDISRFTVIFTDYAPYGDFFNLILDFNFADEKLIRTYFHQLIQGLKYLHTAGIAHLDLKLENVLLGKDFQLKIADFDLAQFTSDESLISGGTANYRAPEVLSGTCKNFCAADVYSAGICLYTLMTSAFPFFEEEGQLIRYDTFVEKNEQFWAENVGLLGDKVRFSETFKELVNRMLAPNPSERINLDEIMTSSWYNEPVYSEEELKIVIQEVLRL